jgi:hypothetical protein
MSTVQSWVRPPGKYSLSVGASSGTFRLNGKIPLFNQSLNKHDAIHLHSKFSRYGLGYTKEYTRKTRKHLVAHPLAEEIRGCHSPDAILAVVL